MPLTPEEIAEVCHELNRAYCAVILDPAQPSWSDAPAWQRVSALEGVNNILKGVVTTPKQSHINWATKKFEDGWRYGPVKDPEAKTHPDLVDYEELTPEQRIKDTLFFQTVQALMSL